MEFNVVDEKVSFRKISGSTKIITRRCTIETDNLALRSISDCAGELNNPGYDCGVNPFRKTLKEYLFKDTFGLRRSRWSNTTPSESERLYFTVYLAMTSSNTANVKILTRNYGKLWSNMDAQIFDKLMKSALPPNSFGFNLKLAVFGMDAGTGDECEINGEDLKITMLQEEDCFGLEMKNIQITDEMWRQYGWCQVDREGGDDSEDCDYNEQYKLEGKLTLTLRLDHCAVSKIYLESLGKRNFSIWPSNLIIEGMDSDMAILAGGEKDQEKGIKCHKKILSSRSPVFEAMFQVDMSESRNNCVEIVNMTEAGVRAMLKFIYCWDLEDASKNCAIAVELLEAGHLYQIELLEDATRKIIWAKPINWLPVDLALKLFLSSKDITEFEKIHLLCYGILKWYAKKSGSLMASEGYQRLFLECPRIQPTTM